MSTAPTLDEGEVLLFDHIPSLRKFKRAAVWILALTLIPTAVNAVALPDTIWVAVPLFVAAMILMQERFTMGKHRAWVTNRRIILQGGHEVAVGDIMDTRQRLGIVSFRAATGVDQIILFRRSGGVSGRDQRSSTGEHVMEIVSEHEFGKVRVFHFDPVGDGDAGVQFQTAIGVAQIDAAHMQHVVLADLGAMTLGQFLTDGYGINAETLANHATDFAALDGNVFILRSSAFLDRPVTLKTTGGARLIATLSEPDADTAFVGPIETTSAEGILSKPAKKKPSDAAMGGRVATIALLVMALLVWLMIWIAG